MESSENPYVERVKMSDTADRFDLMAQEDDIRTRVDNAMALVESMCDDPNADPEHIKSIEDSINFERLLLECLEEADKRLHEEIEELEG